MGNEFSDEFEREQRPQVLDVPKELDHDEDLLALKQQKTAWQAYAQQVQGTHDTKGPQLGPTRAAAAKLKKKAPPQAPVAKGPAPEPKRFPPGFDPDAKAAQLYAAMDGFGTDERTILDVLHTGRADLARAIERAFDAKYSPNLATMLVDELSGDDLKKAQTLLKAGQPSLTNKLYEAIEGWGTDEERIFDGLERATPKERTEVLADPVLMAWLKTDLSAEDYGVAEAYLRNKGLVSAKLLRSVMGAGTDEAAIWQTLANASPAEKLSVQQDAALLAHLKGDLNAPDQLKMERMLAGTLSAADKVEIAIKGWGTDENALKTALKDLTAADVKALPYFIGAMIWLDVSGADLDECQEILHQKRLQHDPRYAANDLKSKGAAGAEAGATVSQAKAGESTSAVFKIQAALAGMGTDEAALWDVLGGLSAAEGTFIKAHDPEGVMGALQADLSTADYQRALRLMGGDTVALKEQLRITIERWGTDEKRLYDALDAVVKAGETKALASDAALMGQLRGDLSGVHLQVLQQILKSGQFTPMERLRWATAGNGTDEARVTALCKEHRALWFNGDFATGTVHATVDALLKSELSTREYWAAYDALRGEPKSEQDKLARAKEELERERGGTVSPALMDAMAHSGNNADDAWREYQATYNQGYEDGTLDTADKRKLQNDEKRSRDKTAAYRALKKNIADWAAEIAVAIIAITATALTAGAAGPFVLALGGQSALIAEAMVLAAASKVGINAAIRGEGYDLTSAEALMDALTGAVDVGMTAAGRGVAKGFLKSVSGLDNIAKLRPAMEQAFGPKAGAILFKGLDTSVTEGLGGLVDGAIATGLDEKVWEGDINTLFGSLGDHMTSKGLGGVKKGFVTGVAAESFGQVFGPKVRGLLRSEAEGPRLKVNGVDVNTASTKELMTLPGIGQARAKAIVAYRTANGPFDALKDITAVRNVGAKTLQTLAKDAAVPTVVATKTLKAGHSVGKDVAEDLDARDEAETEDASES